MKVLISTSTFAEYARQPIDLLEAAGFVVVLNPYNRRLEPKEVIEMARNCQGIIAGTEPLTENVLGKLPSLRAISRCGAGLDNVDLNAAKKYGIKVKNTPDAPTQAVAELTLGLMLDLCRGISFMDRQIRGNKWEKKMGRLLHGKTVGIIGLGRIGKRVAELLKPFEVNILGCEPKPDIEWMKNNRVRLVGLEELLRKSDVVTLHMPYSKENHHFIDAKRLKIMKRGALLINTSRGGLVDESALYNVLKEGHLSGAAIDAFEEEPYHGSLMELDTVVLTPHIGSYAREARVQMELDAAKNLIEMLEEK